MDGKRGSKPSLPDGITHKQSHYAQTLADHPQEIDEVIKEARENEDIPTRSQSGHGRRFWLMRGIKVC